MALVELREKLPHGDIGRIINSYLFAGHPDTLIKIREYRESLRKKVTIFHKTITQSIPIYQKTYIAVIRCVRCDPNAYFKNGFPICVKLSTGHTPGVMNFTAYQLNRSINEWSRLAGGYVFLATMYARWVYSINSS